MLKLCKWWAAKKSSATAGAGWLPGTLRPDLRVTFVQPAAGGPQNLVPPSSFEPHLTAVEKELRRSWDDVTFRCQWKAELRAAGVKLPTTRQQAEELLEAQAEEVRQAASTLRRVQILNRVKPPLLRPATFGHVQTKRIKVCGGYLQALQPQTVLFTGTFNSYALGKLARIPGAGGEVVSNFNREVSRRCKRAGRTCLWLGVVEVGLKRWEKYREPGLHYHFLLVNKNSSSWWEPYFLSGRDLQAIWDASIRKVLKDKYDNQTSRTEMKAVKRDVVGYISKYLTKSEDIGVIDWTDWQGIVPRQYVYTSAGLRKVIKAYSLPLEGEFGEWLGANRWELKKKGLCTVHTYAPEDRPIGLQRDVQFSNVKAAAICLAQFEKDKRRRMNDLYPGLGETQPNTNLIHFFTPVSRFQP